MKRSPDPRLEAEIKKVAYASEKIEKLQCVFSVNNGIEENLLSVEIESKNFQSCLIFISFINRWFNYNSFNNYIFNWVIWYII